MLNKKETRQLEWVKAHIANNGLDPENRAHTLLHVIGSVLRQATSKASTKRLLGAFQEMGFTEDELLSGRLGHGKR